MCTYHRVSIGGKYCTYQRVSIVRFFWKMWLVLFSYYPRFEICLFVLLRTIWFSKFTKEVYGIPSFNFDFKFQKRLTLLYFLCQYFPIFWSKYKILSKQSRTSLFLGILKKDFCWKLKFFCSFSGNKGLKIFSRRPFTTLNISVVRNKRFLIWK